MNSRIRTLALVLAGVLMTGSLSATMPAARPNTVPTTGRLGASAAADDPEDAETGEPIEQDPATDDPDFVSEIIVEPDYASVHRDWTDEGVNETPDTDLIHLTADQFTAINGSQQEEADDYGAAWMMESEQGISVSFEIDEAGLYDLSIEYIVQGSGLLSTEAELTLDGEIPYYEARRVLFPVQWMRDNEEFAYDTAGHAIDPSYSENREDWLATSLQDPARVKPESLKLNLGKGEHEISLTLQQGELLLGDIRLVPGETRPTYSEYRETVDGEFAPGAPADVGIIREVEAETAPIKSSTTPRAMTDRDLSVTPYETYRRMLNVFGGDTWQQSGEQISWVFDVPEDGYYQLGFRYKQEAKMNEYAFRTVRVNDQLPFAEAKAYRFPYSEGYRNLSFGDAETGDDYLVYLEQGEQIISLEADTSPYVDLIAAVEDAIAEVAALGLEIRLLTGNNQDPNRDWIINDFIEDIDGRMFRLADSVEGQMNRMLEEGYLSADNMAYSGLVSSIRRVRNLAAEPNRLPARLNQLSEGTSSVNQSLSDALTELRRQPLTLDKLYLYQGSRNHLPEPESSFWLSAVEGIKRFFNSFRAEDTVDTEEEVVTVWVNRARVYLDLMQRMADTTFTTDTGIKIRFSLMPDENKLILANSAGMNPDVALGVSTNRPFDLAIRNSLVDMRQLDGFKETARQFSPGAILSYVLEDGVYGLPETQDFYVTFYRTDILERLNIPVPETWQEVINILPELQRYGMNYYSPLSSQSALKPFMFTAPFIYQNGGNIYRDDGVTTALTDEPAIEAVRLMTDLFTIYGLPLQVPNFYNEFRYATIPIGLSNFADYMRLRTAAPEIAGSWEIAPAPGMEQEDGEIARWNTGSAQGTMIFNTSERVDEAWEFLKWWLSADTQISFAHQIQTLYGEEYVWNSANLEAFAQLPWPEEHKAVILEQWEWMIEVPKTPAGYMVERELSNSWNTIVFDDANPRSTIDDKTLLMEREMRRKLEEFGYMEGNEVIRPFPIPSIETVEAWLR